MNYLAESGPAIFLKGQIRLFARGKENCIGLSKFGSFHAVAGCTWNER